VYRLSVHFEYLEFPFAVVAGKAVGIADIVAVAVVGKVVGIAVAGIADIADIVGVGAAGKAVGLAARSCLVELPIPSLMMILITVIPLLKFSF
jgi:hypothetical protein